VENISEALDANQQSDLNAEQESEVKPEENPTEPVPETVEQNEDPK